MIPGAVEFILLCLWGGWVALDGTSVGQVMISRPLVAATIAGWIVGAPSQGAVVGVVLEALHLTVLPVGAARYPEGGPAAIVAAGTAVAGGLTASSLLTAVVFALAWERVAGDSVRRLRQFNIRLVAGCDSGTMRASGLERRQLAAIGLDLLRGIVLVAGGIPLLGALLVLTGMQWALGEQIPAVLIGAAGAGALAGALQLFGGKARLSLFVAGALTGIAASLLR